MNIQTVLSRGDYLHVGIFSIEKRERRLKVERLGDPWRGKTFSGIRLKGYWLAEAGFAAGKHVRVCIISPGVTELRLLCESETAEQQAARPGTQEQIEGAIGEAYQSSLQLCGI
jgi:hypothetical protein